MIVLFTDFGLSGPYVGQMKAAIARRAPDVRVIDLFSDAPSFDPMASAYLLAAYSVEFPPGTVFLCVVDPGVGSAERAPVMVEAGGRWYVGPDNGLFAIVARRAGDVRWRRIDWRPERLSASFHGRDLFAPTAAHLALGSIPESTVIDPETTVGRDRPDDLARIVYIDHFGNAMTGYRAAALPAGAILRVGDRRLARARTFSDVPPGETFWYENANGLAEIAANRAPAATTLALTVGSAFTIV